MATVDELISAVDAAAYLGVSRARLYAITRTGRIGRQVGGYWLYTRAELDAYQAGRNPKGGRPKGSTRTVPMTEPVKQ